MSSWQTLRLVSLLLCLIGTSVSICLFWNNQLYFCVFFSSVMALVIFACLVAMYSQATRRVARIVESIRYHDFSLSLCSFILPSIPSKFLENPTPYFIGH